MGQVRMMAVNDSIYFYDSANPYYEFTNFYPAPFVINGVKWPTSEHYFQAGKFATGIRQNAPMVNVILSTRKASDVFKYANSNSALVRSEWKQGDDFKNWVMWEALWEKFRQNPALRQMLLSTGTKKLYEDSPVDSYWGIGVDGQGFNVLGRMLMAIRDSGKL